MLAIILVLFARVDFSQQLKDAHEFMMGVAEKMPVWDADKLGQFERAEITVVKDDITTAEQAEDPDEFLIDIEQLHVDVDKLCALDDALNKNHVI